MEPGFLLLKRLSSGQPGGKGKVITIVNLKRPRISPAGGLFRAQHTGSCVSGRVP